VTSDKRNAMNRQSDKLQSTVAWTRSLRQSAEHTVKGSFSRRTAVFMDRNNTHTQTHTHTDTHSSLWKITFRKRTQCVFCSCSRWHLHTNTALGSAVKAKDSQNTFKRL